MPSLAWAIRGSTSRLFLPRSSFGQNFSCWAQGHISGVGNPHSFPTPQAASMGAVLQFCLQSYLSAPLSSQTSGTDPMHSWLRLSRAGSISQLQGTYLEDTLHVNLWLEGNIPHPGTLKGSGGYGMVWRRSLSGPLFILSLIFFSLLDRGRGCPEPSHKTSSWAAFSAHLPAVGMRVKFHTKI